MATSLELDSTNTNTNTTTGTPEVFAISDARTNAELVVSCRTLGYLSDRGEVLDATYGKAGAFWSLWRPAGLVTNDLMTGNADHAHDFTALPDDWARRFTSTVFDPPYKLNGTPAHASDDRYGVGTAATVAERLELIDAGMVECARVLAPGGHLLVKLMDQVVSGRVVWQTHRAAALGDRLGLRLVDALHIVGYRAQSKDRPQVHARRNYSTLMVFRKAVAR